jgi:hypothetical protein
VHEREQGVLRVPNYMSPERTTETFGYRFTECRLNSALNTPCV